MTAIGLGAGLIGSIGKFFGGGNAQLEKLIKLDPKYTANPIAANRLSLAQTLLNARMPGAANYEANIYGTQANQQANIERNSTDASTALALGAASQGQTNKAFSDLSGKEAEDYQRRYGNLVTAQQGEIEEGDKVYRDQVRRFEDMAKIRGAQIENSQNAWGSLSNLGFGVANFGLSGGFNGMFNARQNNNYPYTVNQPNPYGTGGPTTF